ncbi:MAG TPA: CpsB/CapC family capsule biosynthesis tyrosine phosphatase [Thermodesulfovibrionales bacterium]|nr:CpsB/CapC family capsule biosynthesis tyrosine phosphatase [Thermodesulfovibrionales bacterium]
MIDIHCHILPGIDDGPEKIETTMEMLRMAEKDGITHIVASPHFRCQDAPTLRDIEENIGLVRREMEKSGMAIGLLMGADIRLTYELIACLSDRAIPSINGSRYFLLELPDIPPPHLEEFIHETRVKGYVPIITHPERNYRLLESPLRSEALRKAGALLQLTAMSITGDFGRQIRKYSLQLLKSGCVDFVASDAHGINRRVPVLSKAFHEVSSVLDRDAALRMFVDSPKAVIENRELG